MKNFIKSIKENKIFISILLVAIAMQIAIYCYVILNRQYIYVWDYQCYYKQQMALLDLFHQSIFDGLKDIVKSTYNSDYGNFLLFFTSPFFALTNKTPNAFVFTYMAVGVIPTLIVFAMILKKLVDKCNVKNKTLAYILGMLFLVTFQNTLVASVKGQPDSVGLFWAGLIIYLLIDIDFSKVQKVRWSALILSTFFLIITRRWYMFFAVGLWLSFGIIELITILISKNNKNTEIGKDEESNNGNEKLENNDKIERLAKSESVESKIIENENIESNALESENEESEIVKNKKVESLINYKASKKQILINFFEFVILAIIIDGILVFPMIRYTLVHNYANSYKAWNMGGLGVEIKSQIAHLGILELTIILAGAICGVIKKDTRKITLTMLFTYIIAIVLFTRIQNMGYHQMLILCPTYIILFFDFIITLDSIKIGYIKYALQVATIIIITLNFIQSEVKYSKNKWLTNINFAPSKMDNYEQIREVHDFIVENCDINNKAYINAAGKYCKHTFSNFNLPDDMWLDKVIPYELSIDSVHGFPVPVFTCKYVFVTNIVDESTGAAKGHIIPGVKKGITEDDVISKKFNLVRTFDMNDGIIFYCYERISPFDEDERNAWLAIFSDVSETYPRQFRNVILAY